MSGRLKFALGDRVYVCTGTKAQVAVGYLGTVTSAYSSFCIVQPDGAPCSFEVEVARMSKVQEPPK